MTGDMPQVPGPFNGSAAGRGWTGSACAWAFATIVAAGLSFFLARIPVQVSDSLGNLVAVHDVSFGELLEEQFWSNAYFRPLLLVQTKALLEASGQHPYAVFRGFQIAQVFAALWLFVRLLRIRTTAEGVAAMIAIAVLAGSHTFAGMVREAYPINNYLTVGLCFLVAMNVMVASRARWYTDLLVLAVFIVALGTIETGLLVFGAVAVGAMAGCRGISRSALAAAALVVIAYFLLRFVILDVGMPAIIERSSGYGFARLDPDALNARFGASPWRFYAYNVAASIGTVLVSEPRAGVWVTLRALQQGEVAPWMYINLAASLAATVLIAWFVAAAHWWRSPAEWSHGQRLVAVGLPVILANGAISFPYAKDQIMSVAGIAYAAAAFAAVAARFEASPPRWLSRGLTAALVCIASVSWGWRVIGLQYQLMQTAVSQRNDWAYTDLWIRDHPESQRDPEFAALVESLRVQALRLRVPIVSSPLEPFFDTHTD